MERLGLYLRYAVRSFLRGRSRSLFGAFCVAAGVAAVVALQTVGANVRNTLTASGQQTNRGDVSVDATGPDLTRKQVAIFARLQRGGTILRYTLSLDRDATAKKIDPLHNFDRYVALTGVDPRVYPFYDRIAAQQPAGLSLRGALAGPHDAAVSPDVFDHLRLHLGETIVLESWGSTYTVQVRAVLPENAEPFGSGFLGASDFVFVRYTLLASPRDRAHAASHVYITTRSPAAATAASRLIAHDLGPLFDVNTAAAVLAQASDISRQLNGFLTFMGLVALLIGGIGVVNTMLVTVRRRVGEIAVLKALGMKGRQVIAVFLLDALLLGLIGSVVGAVLGLAASVLVNGIAASLVGADLVWRPYAAPLIVGIVVGVLVSAVFAFLPVLRASETRPLAVLRQDAALLPHGGRGRNLLAVLALTALLGVVASYLIDLRTPLHPVVLGLLLGYGVLGAVGLCLLAFLGVIWLVSRLPGLGRLTLRLAFRNMGRQRRRMAATLLALFIGILSIGSVAIVAGDVKGSLRAAVGTQLHANMLVFSAATPAVERRVLDAARALPGFASSEQAVVVGDARLASVNGVALDTVLRRQAHGAAVQQHIGSLLSGLFGRDLRVARLGDRLSAGRLLSHRDIGTHNALIVGKLAQALNLHVGDRLGYATGAGVVVVRVAGIVDARAVSFTFGTTVDDALTRHIAAVSPDPAGDYDATYIEVADRHLSAGVAALRRALPRAYVLDLSALIPAFDRLIDKLALFPEIIAALALFAGAVIIANSVALTVLERRHEIAVMKAVGARGGAVLRLLLVESAVVGLVGGVLGVLAALLIVMIVDHVYLSIAANLSLWTDLALVALAVVVAVAASLLSAWPASRETPLAVLRYE